jgi:hypothetical protein
MKKTIICTLIPLMLCLPVLSFAAAEIEALNSLPGSKDLLSMSGGTCIRWEQQCKEDPFDAGKVECTQHCSQYDNSDQSGGNNSSGSIFEMDPLKAALGLLIVAGLLYWALNIK